MENRARQKAKESERRVLKSAHGCCKGSMTKMKRGQTENPDSVHREGGWLRAIGSSASWSLTEKKWKPWK